jgi:hypothetical protein
MRTELEYFCGLADIKNKKLIVNNLLIYRAINDFRICHLHNSAEIIS